MFSFYIFSLNVYIMYPFLYVYNLYIFIVAKRYNIHYIKIYFSNIVKIVITYDSFSFMSPFPHDLLGEKMFAEAASANIF